MKTLADFKRRMALGTLVHVTVHHNNRIPDKGVRPVSIHQSSSFALKTDVDGVMKDSWCDWPKASNLKIIDADTVEIYDENRPDVKTFTITFVSPEDAEAYKQYSEDIPGIPYAQWKEERLAFPVYGIEQEAHDEPEEQVGDVGVFEV